MLVTWPSIFVLWTLHHAYSGNSVPSFRESGLNRGCIIDGFWLSSLHYLFMYVYLVCHAWKMPLPSSYARKIDLNIEDSAVLGCLTLYSLFMIRLYRTDQAILRFSVPSLWSILLDAFSCTSFKSTDNVINHIQNLKLVSLIVCSKTFNSEI